MTDIAGKNILITGAAAGIGRLMALRMARLGGNVVLWDIDQKALERAVREINAATNKEPKSYLCDVSKRENVYEAADQVKRDVGPVDILINNAGVVSGKDFLSLPDEKIEMTFGVNTLALFWTAKSFLPSMIERNSGHVVTIASASGLIGVAKLSDYSASKWAAIGFDESLRVELKRRAPGVKTTVVCPYYIDTGMFAGVKSRFSFLLPILDPDRVAKRIVDSIANNRARLMMPPLVGTVPMLRALPISWFDTISNILGINVSMEDFIGRQQKDEKAPNLREVINES